MWLQLSNSFLASEICKLLQAKAGKDYISRQMEVKRNEVKERRYDGTRNIQRNVLIWAQGLCIL